MTRRRTPQPYDWGHLGEVLAQLGLTPTWRNGPPPRGLVMDYLAEAARRLGLHDGDGIATKERPRHPAPVTRERGPPCPLTI